MPFERKQETLQQLIGAALRDPVIHETIQRHGLREARLSQRILDRHEEVWNAAGSEIEMYNKAEAAALAAGAVYRQQLDGWLSARMPFSRARWLAEPWLYDRVKRQVRNGIYLFLALLLLDLIVAAAVWFPFLSSSPTEKSWVLSLGITFSVFAIIIALLLIVSRYLTRSRGRLDQISADLLHKTDLANLQAVIGPTEKGIRDAVLNKGILPVLREVINLNLAPSYATEFPDIEPQGLDQVPGPVFPTDTWAKLTDMLQTMDGGSIGLAGPRGAGKTTIMRWFCGERAWRLRDREVLSVLVPAPSDYEARDFILYLFYAVCRRVLQINQIDVEQIGWSRNAAAAARPRLIVGLLVPWRLTLMTVGLVFLTLGLLTAAAKSLPHFDDPPATSTKHAAGQSGASPSAASGPTSNANQPPAGRAAAGQQQHTAAPSATSPPATTPATAPPPSGLSWPVFVEFEAALGLTASRLVFGGIALMLIGYGTQVWYHFETRAQARGEQSTAAHYLDALLRDGRPFVADAVGRLQMIKFQQSYTAGWSGALKFPIVEGGIKQDMSLAERPLSLPEIVASFSGFLERLGRDYWVLIGIDELDKIHPGEKAEKFLNDIKIIFGLPRVFYLVSISENALSAFERRGIPIRNVFDSCFDDVIYVGYLDFPGSCGVLRQKVIGTPHPFLFLCYCISGGLPRDLVRICRNLIIWVQDHPDHRSLAELCLAVVGADLAAKLHANEIVASEIPLERHVLGFLQELQVLRTAIAQVKLRTDYGRLVHELRSGSELWLYPLPTLRAADEAAKKAFGDLKQLRFELAVYLAYLSIIVAFFADEAIGENEFIAAEGRGLFDDVAKIRQSLAMNPALAAVLAKQLADNLSSPVAARAAAAAG